MGAAYSDDLRRKFLEAYQRGEGSLEVLAGRFGVSLGWAEKIWRSLRQTGRMERPARSRSGPASKVTAAVEADLGSWIRRQPDLTLAELKARLSKERKLELSISRLWTVLDRMGLRLKKSHSTPPSRTRRKSGSGGASGKRKPARSMRRG
jgi:transposase